MEKYSVLMSLYYKEQPEFFRVALESMINQTIPPDEIVLVEDGPLTDELYKVVDEYSEFLNTVINKKNLGLGLALNKGLLTCRNELVARMDTDDVAVKDRCEKQLSFFENNPETSILGGQIEEFTSSPEEIVGKRIVPEMDNELKEFMKKRCPFNHMTVMFRKSKVLEAGNYQDWFWNEDYYLWIRMALKGQVFANLPDTLVYTRVGEDMYQRRGGKKYYNSEMEIQKLLLRQKMIAFPRFSANVIERIIIQLLLPNSLRSKVYSKFARKH